MSSKPLISKYQDSWVHDFSNISDTLSKALEEIDVTIEHVGSTSVPMLDAKAIIDIDIIYNSEVLFSEIKARLVGIGYYHNGNQGIKDREVFKRHIKGERHLVLDNIKHHLFVCPFYSIELKRHLLFRDYLRKNENVRKLYQKIKYDLAEKACQDRKRYADLKQAKVNSWINNVIEMAEKEMNRQQ